MNRTEHLLAILAEECAEVAQRATKALRFTLHEVQPGQLLNNAERIRGELADLLATVEMIEQAEAVRLMPNRAEKDPKREKVERFLLLSESLGALT